MLALMLVVITWLAYANTLGSGFVGDDYLVIVNNWMIRSWDALSGFLSPHYITTDADLVYEGTRNIGSGEASYRPVVTLSYFLDRRWSGLDPFGYHLTGVLIHSANALLLYFLFIRFGCGALRAFAASAFFALHPVNAEAVNVISYREDLLAFFFAVAAYLLYRRETASERSSAANLLAIPLLYLLALLSKESAIVLPGLIAADEWSLRRGTGRRRGPDPRIWAGLFAATALYLALWFYFGGVRDMLFPSALDASTRWFTALKVFGIYAGWILCPVNVHILLPEPSFFVRSWLSWDALAGALFIAASALLYLEFRAKDRLAAFGLAWFAIALVPVSGLVPIRHMVAARFLYLPLAGAALAFSGAAAAFARAVGRRWGPAVRHRVMYGCFLGLLLFFSFFTIRRGVAFSENLRFWREASLYAPNNGVVRMVVAGNRLEAGDIDGAIRDFQAAIDAGTDASWGHHGLGICYYAKRDFAAAAAHFREAVRLNPSDLDARLRLGNALGESGDMDAAVSAFKEVLAADRESAPALNNLGVTYARMGRTEEAREVWTRLLKNRPDDESVRQNLKRISEIKRERAERSF